jgi:integrase
MRGTVAKKGDRWYAVIYDGIDPVTGKDRRRWVPAGTRRSDADKLVVELVKRRNDGEPVVTERLTVRVYLMERWLPLQRSQLRHSTYDQYRRNIELHVLPGLGSKRLDKLTVHDLDRLYVGLLEKGRKDKRIGGLNPRTVRKIHLVLHKALADAERKGMIARNVAALADAPAMGASKKEGIKAWDATQLRTFLTAMRSHRLLPAFHLAAHTGMRRGEVLGVRWGDIDLEANRLSVRQALVSVGYVAAISDVKTGSARRTIDLDTGTVDRLRAWRDLRVDEGGTAAIVDGALAFTKPDGREIHPDSFSQTFDRAVAKLDLPAISLHDLRHTHATLLLKAGVPIKVVSERLGHASAAFTMTVYQHVLPGMQAAAAATFAELLDEAEDDDVPSDPTDN